MTHNPRVKGIPKYANIQQEFIECACGCGQIIERFYSNAGHWFERQYVHNHHKRGIPAAPKNKESNRRLPDSDAWRAALADGIARRSKNVNWKRSVSRDAALERWDKRGRVRGPSQYPPEFSYELRLQIRRRDKFKCQICGVHQKGLSVHHIDCNKFNNQTSNLVSLCRSCHLAVHRKIQRTGTFVLFQVA